MNKLLPLIIFTLMISSCGNDQNPSEISSKRIDPISNTQSGECEFNFEHGPQVNDSFSNDLELKAGLFGKKYPFKQLNTILPASSQSIIEYAQRYLDVLIFKGSNKENYGCRVKGQAYFAKLDRAPVILDSIWTRIVESLGVNSTLLGLYKPEGDLEIADHTDKSVIYLLPQSDKWTLVHEVFHHLFRIGIVESGGLSDDDLFTKFEESSSRLWELFEAVENSDNKPDQTLLKQVVDEYVANVDIKNEILVRFSLEESTIEKELLDRLYANELKLVERNNESIAYEYLASSSSLALSYYNDMDDFLINLKALNEVHGASAQVENLDKLNKAANVVSEKISEISRLSRWVEKNKPREKLKVDKKIIRLKFLDEEVMVQTADVENRIVHNCKHRLPKKIKDIFKTGSMKELNILLNW